MKHSLVGTIVVTLLSLRAPDARADEAALLYLGSRIRVTTDRRIVGTLLARDDQSFTLAEDDGKDPVVLPRASITRVEQSLRPARKAQAALVGAGAGIAVAIAVGAGAASGCDRNSHDCETHSQRLLYGGAIAALSSVLFVPLGAVLGTSFGGERWRDVALDRVKVGLAPTRGRGIAGGVSFSF